MIHVRYMLNISFILLSCNFIFISCKKELKVPVVEYPRYIPPPILPPSVPPDICSDITRINPIPGSTYLTNLSEGKYDITSVIHNNKIFYAGGWNNCSASDNFDVYDVLQNTILSLHLPTP